MSVLAVKAHPAPGALREPGGILLISCYEMGRQPLGVLLPFSLLEEKGFSAALLDLSVQDLDLEAVRRARMVAISVPMHTALRIGARVIESVRSVNPDAHVCVFGLDATLNAEYLLEHGADSCIGGNCEEALLSLAESLDAGSPPEHNGIMLRTRAATSVLTRPRPVVLRRGVLPALDRYAHLENNGGRELAGYVEASRGCLHTCKHCPIPPVYGGRFFVFSADDILDDIDCQVAMGAAHITFGDPDFLNGPGHAMAIVREMRRRHPALTFDATIKVEHILENHGLFPELRACGCLFVVSAVESLSDRILSILDKGHTRVDVTAALVILRSAGVTMRPTWVSFTPWTTSSDYNEMLQFIESNDLIDCVDPVQYSVRLLVPPGSLLLASPAMTPYLGALQQETFSHAWLHPDPRMDRLQERVAALVESDASEGADPAATFYQVAEWAASLCGESVALRRSPALPDRRRAPRLSEPWFC